MFFMWVCFLVPPATPSLQHGSTLHCDAMLRTFRASAGLTDGKKRPTTSGDSRALLKVGASRCSQPACASRTCVDVASDSATSPEYT